MKLLFAPTWNRQREGSSCLIIAPPRAHNSFHRRAGSPDENLEADPVMSFVRLTRPDNSPIAINPDEIVHLAPVPESGALMGPLSTGTRIVFRNQSHQDVRELLDEVVARLDAAHAPATATGPATRVPRKSRS
jgi:hypothetical protein